MASPVDHARRIGTPGREFRVSRGGALRSAQPLSRKLGAARPLRSGARTSARNARHLSMPRAVRPILPFVVYSHRIEQESRLSLYIDEL
jgi:hypothetical protein